MTTRSRLRHRLRQLAFTLIELLVVLAIVATLLSLVAPRYMNHIDRAKEDVLRENLDRTRRVIDQFRADTGRYPDSLDELVEKRYLRDVPLDPMTDRRDSWQVDEPPAPEQGQVYDLHSGAEGKGSDGRPYREW